MAKEAEYYLVPKTLTDGQRANLQVDASGNLRVAGAITVTGSATSANQTTQITAEQAILAKLPALGTAGTASANVITVQGIASGTALPVTTTGAARPALGTATAPSADVITTEPPAVTQVVSTALEASHVLKASAGQLCSLTVFNSKASAQFILVMNSTTVPSNGAVTLLFPPIPIAAASIVQIDFPRPVVASTGIAVANSSTGTFSLTVGSADCAFYAQVN